MAIIERLAPNGKVIEFDTDEFTNEEIEEYLALPEYEAVEQTPQNTVLEDRQRSFLTDVPLQFVGGVRDGVQSTINLVDTIGDTLGVGDPEKDLFTLPKVDEPDTVAGGLVPAKE